MGVTFQNSGLLDHRGLATFGLSAKPESTNPIGYFGTGLKYAMAVLLRHGCKVTIWFGLEKYEMSAVVGDFRGTKHHTVSMGDAALPFTTELGKTWDLWMAYRELYANCVDEPEPLVTDAKVKPSETCTTICVESKEFSTIHDNRGEIFLQTEPTIKLDGVDIHDYMETSNWIYYRGIRVLKLPKQALFTYNITRTTRLTEDRTLASMSDFYQVLAKGVVKCDHPALIRLLLLANSQYFESQIDYNWWNCKPGETFNKIVERFIGGNTSFNSSARHLYRSEHPKDEPPSIMQYELIHIEQRRKLWAAQVFWSRLGIEIPKEIVHVTSDKKITKGVAVNGHIYLAQATLERSMRYLTAFLYQLYADTKPSIQGTTRSELLLDTLVEFGERLLGVVKGKVS